jgi:hypothetical protein
MAWKITVQATRMTAGKPQDMFLMVDGLKIARRGYPDTPEAGTWVPIEPGWEVFPRGDTNDHHGYAHIKSLVISHAQTLEGKMTSKEVEQAIRALGLAVTRVNGKWRINYRGGKEATAYYTTDDDDALGMVI